MKVARVLPAAFRLGRAVADPSIIPAAFTRINIMGPDLRTAPGLLDVLEKLKQRERILHRPEPGTTRAELESMLEQTFWETGASGRRYSRASGLDVLEQRMHEAVVDIWETSEFHCMEIAPDSYLLTYTLLQGERLTRRATIWRRATTGWKIVYHQGTIVADH
jgi:hypothetical protein